MSARNAVRRIQQWIQIRVARSAPAVAVFSSHLGRDLRPQRLWTRITRPPAPDILNQDLGAIIENEATYNIYFAGTTASVSGVELLLDATRYLDDPHYRFWFSGRGPLDDVIREQAQHDSRIVHWGFVDRPTYLNLLSRATVLVNPRPSNLPENRYNFPSKLMEYLAAGRPTISTATSDVAEYYSEAILLLEEETPQRLARLIERTCQLPLEDQLALGAKARQSVINETWETQAQRLLELMDAVHP
jgi:glycosyltransferase involved in cell wall biosynthesis